MIMKKLFLFLLTLSACLLLPAQEVFVQYGQASFYADKFNGRKTASGEIFSNDKLTAAHLTLPFGSMVKVTNLENHRSIVVRINDRGPYVNGRIIDLTRTAAQMLGFVSQGTARVKIELVSENNTGKSATSAPASSLPEKKKNYYTFIARKASPAGFGIQIGSFSELANLMNITDRLSEREKKKLVIQSAEVNRTRVYRVILGQYASRKEAEKELKKVKRSYPDAFILKY
jgi:rare lipoprotein A